MPRLPRFNLPGIPQHVVQRGNNRQAIFFDDSDCFAYLEWLGKGCRALFEQPIDASAVESIRTALHHNHVLGGERFRAEIGRMMARRLGRAGPGRPRKRAREQADDKRQLDYLEN